MANTMRPSAPYRVSIPCLSSSAECFPKRQFLMVSPSFSDAKLKKLLQPLSFILPYNRLSFHQNQNYLSLTLIKSGERTASLAHELRNEM
ncbi:MAG: hypothetical protein NVSMB49_28850 [Ktedonobacteraceae bacterium]